MARRIRPGSFAGRPDPMIGQVIGGRYRIEARLGEGGMGVVYRARHVLIDRVVALKLIRPDLRGESHLRDWLLREARAANRVDHAHIVQIHDIGQTEDGSLYLVMEYLVGESLASQIAKGPLPLPRSVDILEQMCAALARAHDLGVVHRDLKADNIMLTVHAGRPDFVKILDFGLAALKTDRRLAPKGSVFGTPEYMSPEQARGEDATPLSDLYALGILFFEMVTGRLPFRAPDRDELLKMQQFAPPPRPRELRPDLPEEAERIILRLLQKEPQQRYRDAHHLLDELKALQRNLPQAAWELHVLRAPAALPPPQPPPTEASRVARWTERATLLTRALARAHPGGQTPAGVRQAAEQLWVLVPRLASLEGEIAVLTKRLDAIEKRGRAMRAEMGRKVEELSEERSRRLREAAEERSRARRLASVLQRAELRLEQARARFESIVGASIAGGRGSSGARRVVDPGTVQRLAMQLADAEAEVRALRRLQSDYEQRATAAERRAAHLQEQIQHLRSQLSRYSESLEQDLQSVREQIGKRAREALDSERTLEAHLRMVVQHLSGRPECQELLRQLRALDRQETPPQEASQGRRSAAQAAAPQPRLL